MCHISVIVVRYFAVGLYLRHSRSYVQMLSIGVIINLVMVSHSHLLMTCAKLHRLFVLRLRARLLERHRVGVLEDVVG